MSVKAVFDRLAEFDANVHKYARDAANANSVHRVTLVALVAAKEAVAKYHHDVAVGGREADEAEEVRLVTAWQRLGARVDLDADRGRFDPGARAQEDLANLRKAGAESERAEFVARHQVEIEQALMAEARESSEELAAAVANLELISQKWDGSRAKWARFAGALGYSEGEIPQNPVQNQIGLMRFRINNRDTVPAPRRAVAAPDEIVVDMRTAAAH